MKVYSCRSNDVVCELRTMRSRPNELLCVSSTLRIMQLWGASIVKSSGRLQSLNSHQIQFMYKNKFKTSKQLMIISPRKEFEENEAAGRQSPAPMSSIVTCPSFQIRSKPPIRFSFPVSLCKQRWQTFKTSLTQKSMRQNMLSASLFSTDDHYSRCVFLDGKSALVQYIGFVWMNFDKNAE